MRDPILVPDHFPPPSRGQTWLCFEFPVTKWTYCKSKPQGIPPTSWAFVYEEPWDALLAPSQIEVTVVSLLSSQDAPGTPLGIFHGKAAASIAHHTCALQGGFSTCELLLQGSVRRSFASYEWVRYCPIWVIDPWCWWCLLFHSGHHSWVSDRKFTNSQNPSILTHPSSKFSFYLFFWHPHSDSLFLSYNILLQVTL